MSAQHGVLTILEAAPDLDYRVLALVLVFDIRVDGVLVVADQPQHFLDGRIALAQGYVCTLRPLAILDVDGDDLGMMLAYEIDRIETRGDEVADVEQDGEVI